MKLTHAGKGDKHPPAPTQRGGGRGCVWCVTISHVVDIANIRAEDKDWRASGAQPAQCLSQPCTLAWPRRAGPAWGSEADALYDVETLYFVLDFTIEQFCAFSIVEPPTIFWGRFFGRPNFVWYKLRQYPIGRAKFVWYKLKQCPFGPDPVLRGRKWGRPLLVVPSLGPLRSTQAL